jgi:hypothetical protein
MNSYPVNMFNPPCFYFAFLAKCHTALLTCEETCSFYDVLDKTYRKGSCGVLCCQVYVIRDSVCLR